MCWFLRQQQQKYVYTHKVEECQNTSNVNDCKFPERNHSRRKHYSPNILKHTQS